MSSSSIRLSPVNQSLPSDMMMMIGGKRNVTTTIKTSSTHSMQLPSFSKRLLYLPMVAYEATFTNNNDPTLYLDSRNSLPTSVLEPSLVNFWHQIGVDYHRNIATVHDPKNNGHRPLSASDLDDRIRQRSLTLVGGGINQQINQPTLTTTAVATPHGKAKRSKKRKFNVMKHFITNDSNGTILINDFLQQLNHLWNDYIFKLLQLIPLNVSSSMTTNHKETDYKTLVEDPNFMARITTGLQREKAQLIGAKIRIKDCQHCQQWTGKEGYLVGSTQNTWNVMLLHGTTSKKRRHKKKRKTTVQDPNQEQAGKEKRDNPTTSWKDQLGWKSVVVPKRGSALSLLIPLLLVDKPGTCSNGVDRACDDHPLLVIGIQEDPDNDPRTA